MRTAWLIAACLALGAPVAPAAEPPPPELLADVMPLLKTRCVKCHGPAKSEAGLVLSTPGTLARGGDSGALVGDDLAASLLWQRVAADEMPPEDPLSDEEKATLRAWIAGGADGLPESPSNHASGDHWAFVPLELPEVPQVQHAEIARTEVDRFLLAKLEARGLSFNPEADRATLIRRVAFDLTGLPPTLDEIAAYQRDTSPDAYGRMVDRYLASPHYGERWGKFWLDAAGYADSNGYFSADTDRPLAYRYRDYVVRALNADKPFDRFVVEQLAGDELSGFAPGEDATPEVISLLEATHYLRNGQDGTDSSDGNPDELKNDRYAALETCMQIVGSSLLGLTVGCAQCHDHKFEPITQREYYQLQSVFYPAFNVEDWKKPGERFVFANLPGELEAWQDKSERIDGEIATLRAAFAEWIREHRPPSQVLFEDAFVEGGPPLVDGWSNTAPGDDAASGTPPVALDANEAPGALASAGTLRILESGASGDRWLSTRQAFDWTPEAAGQWIQATFDLVDDKASETGTPAARIAYLIALHDFDDSSPVAGGNLLFDGNPAGGAPLHLDYPGGDSEARGTLGSAKYEPGHNYGVRVTRTAEGRFRLEHLYDHVPDGEPIELGAADLPEGGFGFEYCCGRSFVVDNVRVEQSAADEENVTAGRQLLEEQIRRQQKLAETIQAKEAERGSRPGKIAWMTDRAADPPEVHLLLRGNHQTPGEAVEPAPLAALASPSGDLDVEPPFDGATSTGRRLAWARWVTRDGSRPASLLARVQVNRIWQQYFGTGIVATPDNLGTSGSPPSHRELLDYLAARFVESGWSTKALHRLIVNSAAYRQSSRLAPEAQAIDPENRLLWRRSVRRLDAEALRDAMLATSGSLDETFGGPYVPSRRDTAGEIVVGDVPGAHRRSLYLQQRRTQTVSLLAVFDAPSIVFNCVERPVSTIPLQSLSLLNSDFMRRQARSFAERLQAEAGDDANARLERAFLLALARGPSDAERAAAVEFLSVQHDVYAERDDRDVQSWTDFCQMLLASNAFLYLE